MNERQHRQIACIGEERQATLANSVVVMVGCGGVGSAAGPILAKMGIGRIFVVDRGHVKPTNLGRQIYGDADIGEPKSLIFQKRLERVNPEIKVYSRQYDITTDSYLEMIVDDWKHRPFVILDCTDNIEARRTIERVSLLYRVPWVFSGVVQWSGNVMAFLPHAGKPRLDVLIPPEETKAAHDPHVVGTVTAAVEMVGSIAAAEVCKCLWGEASGDKYITCNAYKPEVMVVTV
jgi:molybdopterin/thiamine biosynthesis adenylyltransferase